jgi:hypothetical protein
MNDENISLFADLLNRWKNNFCDFLGVCGDKNVRGTERHTSEQ